MVAKWLLYLETSCFSMFWQGEWGRTKGKIMLAYSVSFLSGKQKPFPEAPGHKCSLTSHPLEPWEIRLASQQCRAYSFITVGVSMVLSHPLEQPLSSLIWTLAGKTRRWCLDKPMVIALSKQYPGVRWWTTKFISSRIFPFHMYSVSVLDCRELSSSNSISSWGDWHFPLSQFPTMSSQENQIFPPWGILLSPFGDARHSYDPLTVK